MKIYEILNEMNGKLPSERINGSFTDNLQYMFEEYKVLLTKIDESEFSSLVKRQRKSPTFDPSLTKLRLINYTKKLINTINSIIDVYYEGHPSEAYNLFENLCSKNKFAPRRKESKPSSLNLYIKDYFFNLFDFDFNQRDLYRMRISKKTLSKSELFHIPFDKRGLVATQRFSIPGFPCLYFGTSLDVCWMEVGRDLENGENIYASRFNSTSKLLLVNLAIPSEFSQNNLNDSSSDALRYFFTYPIYLACLMKVVATDDTFKPEYIIPQLFLQYVTKYNHYHGFIYSSTKDKQLIGECYTNIVIPTRKITKEGHCSEAIGNFFFTDPLLIKSQLKKDIEKAKEDLKSKEIKKLL